jgi:hypothetical protein
MKTGLLIATLITTAGILAGCQQLYRSEPLPLPTEDQTVTMEQTLEVEQIQQADDAPTAVDTAIENLDQSFDQLDQPPVDEASLSVEALAE